LGEIVGWQQFTAEQQRAVIHNAHQRLVDIAEEKRNK
jgi:predicted Fe-S protein YdhL (DUF1289 family)